MRRCLLIFYFWADKYVGASSGGMLNLFDVACIASNLWFSTRILQIDVGLLINVIHASQYEYMIQLF